MAHQDASPITINELTSPAYGIREEFIRIGNCSLQSDKYITVVEYQDSNTQVAIVDLASGCSVTRQRMSADAAMMHPTTGPMIQIFDLEQRIKLKSLTMPAPVRYWKWISQSAIVLVTDTSVFHCLMHGETIPKKIFDCIGELTGQSQIIDYEISPDGMWSLLVGITLCRQTSRRSLVIDGSMQLYSVTHGVSQTLQGHAGSFAVLPLVPGRADPTQVLCFEQKKPGEGPRLCCMEVGRPKNAAGGVFRVKTQQILFPAEASNDFALFIHVSTNYGFIFMLTKMGFLYLFDVYTGSMIRRERITPDTIFTACEHTPTGGILAITNRKGQVYHMCLDESLLISYVRDTQRNEALALELAKRLNISELDHYYLSSFNALVANGDVTGAAKLAAESPRGILRTPDTLRRFAQIRGQPGEREPIFQYYTALLDHGKLNKFESIALVRSMLPVGRQDLIEKWISMNKLEYSEELGDLLASSFMHLALIVYRHASVPEKVVNYYIKNRQFDNLMDFIATRGYSCDWSLRLKQLVRSSPADAVELARKLTTRRIIDDRIVNDVTLTAGSKAEVGYDQNVASHSCLQSKRIVSSSVPFISFSTAFPAVYSGPTFADIYFHANSIPLAASTNSTDMQPSNFISDATASSTSTPVSSNTSSSSSYASSTSSLPLTPLISSHLIDIDWSACLSFTSFSCVYRGKYRNTDIAIKMLRGGSVQKGISIDLQQPEIAILSNIRHPRIILMLGIVQDLDASYGAALGLVTEYMVRGSLYRVLHSTTTPSQHRIVTLPQKMRVLKDIADGMIFLHSSNVIHRDLKSPNVLLDDEGRAKICDFGVSNALMSSGAGTPAWQAPESFRKENVVRFSSDLYSFGVIIWEMITGEIPWNTYDAMQIMTAVVVYNERLPLPATSPACPIEIVHLVRDCFKEATSRPDFPTALKVLENVLARSMKQERDHVPEDYLCAITYEIMQDPVICADGHTYEREAILEWLQDHDTSPRTNLKLPDDNKNVIPNIALRNAIRQFREKQLIA